MTWAWFLWRVLKFLGVAVFAGGLWSAVTADSAERRLTSAQWVAMAGLVATWIAGYGLLKLTGSELSAPWVATGLFASLLALVAAQLGALRTAWTVPVAGLVAAGFCTATAAMATRGLFPLGSAVGIGVGAGVVAALLAVRLPRVPAPTGPLDERTSEWFWWIARLEGASLLLMVGVAMPVRALTGVSLDSGQGWIGWVHGLLVLLYLQALVITASIGRRGIAWPTLGLVASMVPLGTFVFERRSR